MLDPALRLTTTPIRPDVRPLLKADRDSLAKFLKDKRPILWVGAGASMAAGYPGTSDLVRGMVEAAEDPIDPDLPFFEIADRFVASQGKGDLGDLLQPLLGPPRPPAPLHDAIARLAKAGSFQAIVTTNYEDLLERALAAAGVPYILQPLEQNAPVTVDGHIRLLKLHGSRENWLDAVLSGDSYARFGRQYPFLASQLDVLLRQHPVLLIGCSLEDPRILDWLTGLTLDAAEALKPWRALMTQNGWDKAAKAEALTRGNIRPYILDNHGQLGQLLHAVAGEMKPDLTRLEIEVTVGDRWRARMDGAEWEPADPLADAAFMEHLEALREVGLQALPTDEKGVLSPQAAVAAGALHSLAVSVGDRLTAALLAPAARERLVRAIHAGAGGAQPLLVLRVRPAAAGLDAERRADRALALPWELLRLEERFPVEEGSLDLVREAVVDDLPKLTPPDRPLSIVATVAAPVDAGPFDHEEEMYLLWRALGEKKEEKRLLVTDLGTLDDLAAAVEHHLPPVVHFTGHGRPGVLLFEDEEALSDPVEVKELIQRFREVKSLPRLLYLSACHGTTAGGAPDEPRPGERMVDVAAVDRTAPSTAASLHRAGFPQVVAYFGPVHDRQATRAAAAFYAALGRGLTAWDALQQARRWRSGWRGIPGRWSTWRRSPGRRRRASACQEGFTRERTGEDILEPILPETKEKVGTDLLLGKLWDALPPAAQEHLGRCSVLTQPVPWEAVKTLEPEEGTGRRLLELGLLSPFLGPTGDEWWAPHRLVTEEARQRWRREAREAHLLLAGWLEKRFEAERKPYWAERTVDHFLAAAEADRAWPTARGLILWFRQAGRYQEALGWVERVLAVGLTGGSLGMALTRWRGGFPLLRHGRPEAWMGLFHPELAAGVSLLETVVRNPSDVALLLEAIGPSARRRAGAILLERLYGVQG